MTASSWRYAYIFLAIGCILLTVIFAWIKITKIHALENRSYSRMRTILGAVIDYEVRTGSLPPDFSFIELIKKNPAQLEDPLGVFRHVPLPHYKLIRSNTNTSPRAVFVSNPQIYRARRCYVGFDDNHFETGESSIWEKN